MKTPTIPEGLQTKALALGYGVEVRVRQLAAVPARYRFMRGGRSMSIWLLLSQAHIWLDEQGKKAT